ncbi:MAG: NUDIX hydrolase [Acidimicrobiales bacterium]
MAPADERTHDVVVHHVVVGVLRVADLFLLCHRSPDREWYPDVWDLPGGHVEDGELPLEALRRELREELGIEVTTVGAEPVGRIEDGTAHLDLCIFAVNAWEGSVENRQPDEHDEVRWFALRQLEGLRLAHPDLEEILRGLPDEGVK